MTARAWLGLFLVVLAGALGVASWLRFEGAAPALRGPERLHLGRGELAVAIEASDADSGVRSVALRIEQGERALEVARAERPGNLLTGGLRGASERVEATVSAEALGLREGEARLVATATDWSWRGWLRGNTGTLAVPVTVDLTKPRIAVETGQTYVERGGAGAVVYRVREETRRDGVVVGDAFFPGRPFPGDAKRRIVLFAIPRDVEKNPRIAVIAEDLAGNEGAAVWPVLLEERVFDEVRIDLSPNFLEVKVRELAEAVGVSEETPLAAFQKINTEVRAKNEARIRELVAGSGDEPLFEGAFLQMRNSAVTSRFAEHRSYFVNGERVSQAIHYGYDLASTAGAPIEASNRGRVMFAGELGIYGDCVLLDHGLGLVSLYAHLSQIDVAVGDVVPKSGALGRSGATGLAGGDHLHFAILVGDAYVDPTEWWDGKWVREKVMSRLEGQAAP